jgi:prolipoprotein diacylglyceryltransferase
MDKLLKNLDRWRAKYKLDCSISEHFDKAYDRMLQLTCHCESDIRLMNFLDQELDKLEKSIDLDKKMIVRIKSEIQNLSKTLDPSSAKGSGGVASSVQELHTSFLSEMFLMIFIFFIVFLIYQYFKKHEIWFRQKYQFFYKSLKSSIN